MSDIVLNHVRKGLYLDSVALMRMSRAIAEMNGINEAAMMMGTPANRQIMANAGLLAEAGKSADGGDLIIGIRAVTSDAAEAALVDAQAQIEHPTARGGGDEPWQPRNLQAALKSAPDSNIALISIPGDFAIAEARKAIHQGLHVMIFSDNVGIAEEAELKREANQAWPDGLHIIASVAGTDKDPQNRSVQMMKLAAAGIHVAPTNADASDWALSAIQT